MSDKDYLDPQKVSSIYIPKYRFYILDGGSTVANIDYKFNYDDDSKQITLIGELKHSSFSEPISFTEGSVTLEKMTELLIESCNNSTYITDLYPIDLYKKTIIDKIKEHITTFSKNEIIDCGTNYSDLRVDGRIIESKDSKSETIVAFNCVNISIDENDKDNNNIKITGQIKLGLCIKGSEIARGKMSSSKLFIKAIEESGKSYELCSCSIDNIKEEGPFLTLNFIAEGCLIKQYKRIPKLIMMPKEMINMKESSNNRMNNILTNQIIRDYIALHTDSQESRNSEEHKKKVKDRFSRILTN